jgi:disulfide bond formation protein DsbB
VALVASLHGPKKPIGVRIYAFGIALFALAGAGMAGRHIWLEHLPKDQVPSCGPGLDFILDSFPLSKALPMIFKGSGECAEVHWRFIGLSIAEWAFIWFVIFLLTGLLLLLRRKTESTQTSARSFSV